MDKAQAHNMRLLAHDTLLGNGKMGEGMSIQLAAGGRRILWLAHESAPKNFTGVDVTDPRRPKVVVQTELPHEKVRSNSLEVVGDIIAVAYQVATPGLEPAGLELFDLSKPENPRRIAFFDCSGPHSRGVHQLWFVDGEYLTCAAGAADFTPRNQLDDQVFRMIDVRDPARPEEVGRWWFPGTRDGDPEPPVVRHPRFDSGWRAHNTNVYPARPDRAYLAYLDGGAIVLDIADKARPKMVTHWNPHPPFNGFTHTIMPLFDRDLLVVTDESIYDLAGDWPKRVWIIDARDERKLIPIATLPMPPVEEFGPKGGRYGAHNIHENRPGPAFHSEEIIVGAYFSGGVRVHDIANPFEPKEIASYVPEVPQGTPVGCAQINDVYVDENAIVYAVDRHTGGLYVLEMNL
ncbi:MAG: LVIVD repeat-containing protein [Geminicoccaceae bacterium]